jgi:cob(I)alamin adenosyltransferase
MRLKNLLKEASGQLTTYLEPKQHQALVNVVSSVDELMQSIDDAARLIEHKDIRKWLILSKRELVQIQARLNQIYLRKLN